MEQKNQIKAKELLKKYQHHQIYLCLYTMAMDVEQVEAETGQKFQRVTDSDDRILCMENMTGTFFDDGMSVKLLTGPYS